MAAHFYYQHSYLRDGNVSGFGLSMNFFVEESYPYAIYLIWSAVRRDSDVVLGEFSLVYIRSSFLMHRPVVPQNSWLSASLVQHAESALRPNLFQRFLGHNQRVKCLCHRSSGD